MNRRQFLRHSLTAPFALRAASSGAAGRRPPASSALAVSYHAFVSLHTRNGQVFDEHLHNRSHSEGQGLLMLFSALMHDRSTFMAARRFTARLRRSDGLYSWLWGTQGIADSNDAADGDLYIAWALALGGANFDDASCNEEARTTLRAVAQHLIRPDPHGTILLPGRQGFTRAGQAPVVNLSYWLLPALPHFARLLPDAPWSHLADTGLRLLDYSYFGDWRLPPDWLQLDDPVRPAAAFDARFGYDAIRIPLWLVWSGHADHPVVRRFLRYADQYPVLPAYFDLHNNQAAPYPAGNGQRAILQLARNQPVTQNIEGKDYYQDSLTLLALLAHPPV